MPEIYKALGAVKDPYDYRDVKLVAYLPPRVPTALPSVVEYDMTPIKYQEHLGSCVSFAFSALLEYYHLKVLQAESSLDLSEQAGYQWAKEIDGYEGEGTYPRAVAKVCQQRGIPREVFWPYEGRYPAEHEPLAGIELDAWQYRIATYASVNPTVDAMRAALALNGPFACSFMVDVNVYNIGSNGIVPMPQENWEGGHCTAARGYNDLFEHPYGVGAFKIKNSWSAGFGDQGNLWIPYQVWPRIALDCWSVVDDTVIPKHWPDWGQYSLSEQDLIFQSGAMRGYADGKFRPQNKMLVGHVNIVCRNMGLPYDAKAITLKDGAWISTEKGYAPATRGYVHITFPAFEFNDTRWEDEITRYEFALLLARYLRNAIPAEGIA